MNVCPFCRTPMRNPQAPCHACGRRASEHPSMQAMGGGRTLESAFDDDDVGGELELEHGGAIASHAGPSAYAGGGLSLGDDDPFADDVPQGSLELDLPAHEASKRAAPAAAAVPAGPPPAAVPIPDLPIPAPGPRSSPSMPASAPSMPASAPVMPAAVPPSNPAMPAAVPASNPAMPVPPSNPAMPAAAPPSNPAMPAAAPPSNPAMPAAAPPSNPAMPAAPQSQPMPAPTPRQPPDPAALIARYPPPPDKVWEAPIYAMKVLWRQFELRQDLASLRRKRSPDVPLYERALRTHDPKTFALGLILTCAGLAIASFVFFLPVILRFLWDPY